MALISCPECGKDISDKSAMCIHCGYPIDNSAECVKTPASDSNLVSKANVIPQKKNKKIVSRLLIVLFGIVIIAFIAIFVLGVPIRTETTYEVVIDGQVYSAKSEKEIDRIINEHKNGNLSDSSASSGLSTYTYDEYRMYSTMLFGFNKLMDSLKNPNSVELLGIAYNPEADVAYYCVIAENDFGGKTKSYISYGGKSQEMYESDDHKYSYDSATVKRTFNDLKLFIDAVQNAEDADVPTKPTNEALNAYSTEEQKMFNLVIAGLKELEVLYDDLTVIGHKYSTEYKKVYFWFGGMPSGGKGVVTYASYSDGLGIMSSDAYKELYDNADVDIYSFEIEDYKDAIKKDLSK